MITKSGRQKSCFDLFPNSGGEELKYLYKKFGWEVAESGGDFTTSGDEPYLVDINRDTKEWSKLIGLENKVVSLETKINSRLLKLVRFRTLPNYLFNALLFLLFFGLLGVSAWLTYWETYWISYFNFQTPLLILGLLLVVQWLGSFIFIGVLLATYSDRKDSQLLKKIGKEWNISNDSDLLLLKSDLNDAVDKICHQIGINKTEFYSYFRDLYSNQILPKIW